MAKKKATEETIIKDLVDATKTEVKEEPRPAQKKANCVCTNCKVGVPAQLIK